RVAESNVDANVIALERAISDCNIAVDGCNADVQFARTVDGAIGGRHIAVVCKDVGAWVARKGGVRHVDGGVSGQDAISGGVVAAGGLTTRIANRHARDRKCSIAENMEYIVERSTVDDGRGRACACDGKVLCDVEIARRRGIFAGAWDRESVRSRWHVD